LFWAKVSVNSEDLVSRYSADKQRSSPLEGGLESMDESDSLWWGFGICDPKLNGSQALAPFLAATLKDRTSICGFHAFAESALACTFQL
jgi:hypothetical protein